MQNASFVISLFISLLILMSCGGTSNENKGSETSNDTEESLNTNSETAGEPNAIGTFDSTQIKTAEDAMEQYKITFNQYAESVKNGTAEERAALKEKLDKIMAYSKEKWSTISFKAMDELAKVKAQLDLGNNVDVQKAKEAFNKSFEEFKNLPEVKEDAARMKQEATDFLNKAKEEINTMNKEMNSN